MSQWTHVSGFIRIDGVPFDRYIKDAVWRELKRLMKTELPTGSEGGIKFNIMPNESPNALNIYNIWFFGDLRDTHTEIVDEMVKFSEKLSKSAGDHEYMIRNCIMEVEVEYVGIYAIQMTNIADVKEGNYEWKKYFKAVEK